MGESVDLMLEIANLQDEVREAARWVRNCPECKHAGYIRGEMIVMGRTYPTVRPCRCRSRWKNKCQELVQAGKAYEKQTGETYRDLFEPEMSYMVKVSGESITHEAYEMYWKDRLNEAIGMIGEMLEVEEAVE